MSKTIGTVTNFSGGIADSPKSGIPNSFAWARGVDFRSNPNQVTILPKTIKDSGSHVTDLVLWGERTCNYTWFYGDSGNLYKLDSGAYSVAHTAPDSRGNGLAYYAEDGNMYYAQNETFGRLTQACSTTGTFIDDLLSSIGGEPTNTKSLDLEASSSQSATRADTASLSLTGDFTLEAYVKPESLPTTGNQMTIISKWEEDGTTRSYKLGIVPVSNFFGDARDGSFTNSTTATDDPRDANCTGTVGAYTLTTSNEHASFNPASGDKVVIIQMRGTDSGTKQFANVVSFSSHTLTIDAPLTFSPAHSATASDANKAQVVVLKQYSNYTINGTLSCKAWDGLKGGIIGGFGSGTLSGSGTLNLQGKGFRGGPGYNLGASSGRGEGTGGAAGSVGDDSQGRLANGNGGGSSKGEHSSGASGGNGTPGNNANVTLSGIPGIGGSTSGSSNLTTITMGGGASGTSASAESIGGSDGGGIAFFFFSTIDLSSMNLFNANGEDGQNHTVANGSGGSGGGGGSIHFKGQTVNLGTNKVSAAGGTGGTKSGNGANGVAGGDGRIHVDYLTSVTGTTSPSYTSAEDTSLSSSDGYALRLYISSTGLNSETYTQAIDNPQDSWSRFSVSFDASESQAKFYRNGVLLGTKTGTLTAVHDNASEFAVGCYTNSGGSRTAFFDGLVDDVRVWNDVRTESEILQNLNQVLYGTESNLVAYYQFESNVEDSQTSGNNDLTANNTPTYSNDVPFSGVTTRSDQDQNNSTASGQTYTLTTSINEGATHRQTFVPQKDPYKSIVLNIGAVGTGNWTVTVHNSLNQTVATSTVANANLHTSYYEFMLLDANGDKWRPIRGATYHFHVTSTVTDGTVVTSTVSDLETAYFTSHYQFLVYDEFHPMLQHGNLLCIGNERYLATLEAGDIYNPHRLTFPSGYRLRCLAYWREYLAMGFIRGDSIGDEDDGKIFFWDGTADTYNHFIDVPEGSINTMKTSRGLLQFIAGYSGDLMAYAGGDKATKLKRLPQYKRDQSITFYPGAMNKWKGLTYFGTGASNSDTVERGVYSWGSLNENYPESLGMDYPLSLGVQTSSNVEVGMVFAQGKELYVSWKNSNEYGIDKVTETNSPFSEAEIQFLRADFSALPRPKLPIMLRADFEPLETGESVQLRYKADRGSWVDDSSVSTALVSEARMNIIREVKEVDVSVKLGTTTTTSPTLIAVSLETELAERSRGV